MRDAEEAGKTSHHANMADCRLQAGLEFTGTKEMLNRISNTEEANPKDPKVAAFHVRMSTDGTTWELHSGGEEMQPS